MNCTLKIKMGLVPVLLLSLGLFSLSDASTGSHSLQYFYTGVSDPGTGFPEFYTAGYVDETPIDCYDSVSQQAQHKAEWMRKVEIEDPQYWEQQTQVLKGWQQTFKATMKILMDRYNQSGGVHTYQTMYGCELNRDGSTRGFYQFAYDGHDFISLDKDRLTWVAAMPGAEITERSWNADRNFAELDKAYLEQTCIQWLQKYMQYGAKELNSKVQPNVIVWDRKPEALPVTLHCLVTGFYPREIEVKWMKNGNIIVQGAAAKDILPNHDGTYQIQVSVEIDPQEKATYSCYVDHSSLQESLRVLWEPKPESSSLSIGIIVRVIAVVLFAIVAGAFYYKRQRGGRAPGYNVAPEKTVCSTYHL